MLFSDSRAMMAPLVQSLQQMATQTLRVRSVALRDRIRIALQNQRLRRTTEPPGR